MRSTSHISISNLDSASSQRAREGARREQPGLCISRRKDADEDRTAERGRTTCLAGGRRGPRPTHSNTTHQSRNPPHTHITYHISPLEDQRGNPPGRGTEGKCRWAWASSLQGTCLGTGRAMTRYSRPVIRWDEGNEDTRRPHGIPWRLPLRTLRDPPPPPILPAYPLTRPWLPFSPAPFRNNLGFPSALPTSNPQAPGRPYLAFPRSP